MCNMPKPPEPVYPPEVWEEFWNRHPQYDPRIERDSRQSLGFFKKIFTNTEQDAEQEIEGHVPKGPFKKLPDIDVSQGPENPAEQRRYTQPMLLGKLQQFRGWARYERKKIYEDLQWKWMDEARTVMANYLASGNVQRQRRGAQRALAASNASLLSTNMSLLGSGDAGRKSLLGE